MPRSAAALLLVGAVAALSTAALGLTISFGSPSDGWWTGSSSAAVAGNASGPNADRRLLDTSADFAGGVEINATTTGGLINQTVPANETYRYLQNFTGLANRSYLDEHWMWNLTGTSWQITNSGAVSGTPPSLVHASTTVEHIYWNSILPGALLDGRVSFKYMCEANGFLNAWVSADGSPANETSILAATATPQAQLDYNLTAPFGGARAVYVHFQGGAGVGGNTFCSVDDFEVVANYTRSNSAAYSFSDNFTAGENVVWNGYMGDWFVGNGSGSSDTPPAFYHGGTINSSAWANWGSASAIQSADLYLHYECQAAGSIDGWLSADGIAETHVLVGGFGPPHTVFSYNATSLLKGAKGAFLRLTSYAPFNSTSNVCGVDDVWFNFTVAGNQNLTYTGFYASPVVDLLYPAAFTGADWSAALPAGSFVQVGIRSSINNATFSAWYALPASGASPVPASGRYVQFRVNFTSIGGLSLASVDRLGLNFSALAKVEISVNGGPWSMANGTSSWNATAALSGGSNNITARVTDSTGGTATAVVQVLRDTFPPDAPGKPVGPPVTNLTDANWAWADATDTGLGVDHYLVDVGLTPGGQELGGDLVAPSSNYTVTGLPDNVRVFVRVRAVDLAGLVGAYSAASDPTLVDRTPPGPVSIQGPGAYTRNTTLVWSWSAAADFGSGVGAYRVRLGSLEGLSDVATATTTLNNFTFSGATSGSSYFLSVSALDSAGNEGPLVKGSGTVVDQAPPFGPTNVTGPAPITNDTTLTWSWLPASDALAGIDHYLISVGTSPGAFDIASLTWAGTSYTVSYVPSGARYYFEVRAIDRAGNVGPAATASPVLIDNEAPTAPVLAAVAAFVGNVSQSVKWQAAGDLPATNASGVDHYLVRVTVGSATNASNVSGLSITVDLQDGVRYRISVAAVDRAGNEGAASSLSFTADQSGPLPPSGVKVVVTDASGPTFTATWNGTSDAGSGFKEYRVKVGTTPGGTDVADGSVVVGTSYSWTGKYDTPYFVTVWGVDNLGNAGATNASAAGVAAKKPGGGGGFLPGLEVAPALAALAAAAALARGRRRP